MNKNKNSLSSCSQIISDHTVNVMPPIQPLFFKNFFENVNIRSENGTIKLSFKKPHFLFIIFLFFPNSFLYKNPLKNPFLNLL